jgi:two-component system response regulator FixJ
MSAVSEATIFIVDDDQDVRASLKLVLELNTLAVEDYASTADFVRSYQRPPRGCLLLDQHLPATTGLDFLKSEAGKQLGIPVILITGRGNLMLERRAREAGAVDYLEKPIGESVPITTIRRIIGA